MVGILFVVCELVNGFISGKQILQLVGPRQPLGFRIVDDNRQLHSLTPVYPARASMSVMEINHQHQRSDRTVGNRVKALHLPLLPGYALPNAVVLGS